MPPKSTILSRTFTGRGVLPLPDWIERFLLKLDARRSRIDLAKLDDDRLADIGLTREEVEAEVARSFHDIEGFKARNRGDARKY